MVAAVSVILVLGTLLLLATAYMEWMGLMTIFGPHGTVREIVLHADDAHPPHRP
jgi:hypothetical protein